MRNILIGGAWPYANGSLHIGHIAGLLPGDVLARYHRAVGDNVYFFSAFIEGNLVLYKRDTRIFIIFSQIIQLSEISS